MISINITSTGITVTGQVSGNGSISISYRRGTRKPTTVVIQGNGA